MREGAYSNEFMGCRQALCGHLLGLALLLFLFRFLSLWWLCARLTWGGTVIVCGDAFLADFLTSMMPIASLLSLFERVGSADLLLTPNQRLARFVQSQYADYQRSLGVEAWPRLPCMALGSWCSDLWAQWCESALLPEPLLIDASHEAWLWLSVLKDDEAADALFNSSATAAECRRAWNILQQWRVSDLSSCGLSPEFQRWVTEYRARCHQRDLIDRPSMMNTLLDALDTNQWQQRGLPVPKRIFLIAFDETTPQMQAMFDGLAGLGCELLELSPESDVLKQGMVEQNVRRTSAADAEQELQSAAQWAAAQVAAEPQARVGVVVPDLLAKRDQVERIFLDVFEPQYRLPESARHATPFNMSAGVSLASTPPTAAALSALKLNGHDLDIEDVSEFLLSPFFFDEAGLSYRAKLEAHLRERFLSVRLSTVRAAAGELATASEDEVQGAFLNAIAEALRAFHQGTIGLPKSQPPSQWVQVIEHQLNALAWPGNRTLDTLEFQQIEVWQRALAQLRIYDHSFASMSYTQAIALLERIAVDTQFQAQTKDSPVQVLGVFEAAGMVFDHLWVTGLDNSAWPAPLKPNALLPVRLQKQRHMPMASPERELQLAKRITERFERSAGQVVMSYSRADGDKSLQASALIEHFEEVPIESVVVLADNPAYTSLGTPALCEHVQDHIAPYVEHDLEHMETIRGGTQLLKDQAACPFRAFARHRLQAKNTEAAAFGLTPAQRGSLLHYALESIWRELRDQRALLALDDAGLDALIEHSSVDSLRLLQKLQPHLLLGEQTQSLEKARMHKLLRAWMSLEKQRAPFSVVLNESRATLTLAGLPITMRYDRVDALADGALLVLDYKTAKVSLNTWAGERPDEPQVPLYAIANQDQAVGAAFGQVNVEEVAIKGLAAHAELAPGLKLPEELSKLDLPDNWSEVLAHWRHELEALAQEFMQGHAEVLPKHGDKTCRYCDLQPLCRIKDDVLAGASRSGRGAES